MSGEHGIGDSSDTTEMDPPAGEGNDTDVIEKVVLLSERISAYRQDHGGTAEVPAGFPLELFPLQQRETLKEVHSRLMRQRPGELHMPEHLADRIADMMIREARVWHRRMAFRHRDGTWCYLSALDLKELWFDASRILAFGHEVSTSPLRADVPYPPPAMKDERLYRLIAACAREDVVLPPFRNPDDPEETLCREDLLHLYDVHAEPFLRERAELDRKEDRIRLGAIKSLGAHAIHRLLGEDKRLRDYALSAPFLSEPGRDEGWQYPDAVYVDGALSVRALLEHLEIKRTERAARCLRRANQTEGDHISLNEAATRKRSPWRDATSGRHWIFAYDGRSRGGCGLAQAVGFIRPGKRQRSLSLREGLFYVMQRPEAIKGNALLLPGKQAMACPWPEGTLVPMLILDDADEVVLDAVDPDEGHTGLGIPTCVECDSCDP